MNGPNHRIVAPSCVCMRALHESFATFSAPTLLPGCQLAQIILTIIYGRRGSDGWCDGATGRNDTKLAEEAEGRVCIWLKWVRLPDENCEGGNVCPLSFSSADQQEHIQSVPVGNPYNNKSGQSINTHRFAFLFWSTYSGPNNAA